MPDTPRGAATDSVPVPQRLAEAPVSAGMVVPYITMTHRDPTKPVWGAVNPARLQQIWHHSLCQVCGQRLDGPRVVVYIRPWDYLRGIGPEPALHPECGLYSKRTCPMLAGHTDHYNRHPADGHAATRSAPAGCGRHRIRTPARADVKANLLRRGTRRGSRSRTTPSSEPPAASTARRCSVSN